MKRLILIVCSVLLLNTQLLSQNISITQNNGSETVTWYFELNPDDATATLVAPQSGSYQFANPGREYASYSGNTYNFWSPSIIGMNGESNLFTAVRIPHAVTGDDGTVYSVEAIAPRAFAGSNIAFVHVPSSVVKIGEEAFEGSSLVGIERVSAYEIVPESVVALGKGAFKNCTSLNRIDIGDGVETIEAETFDGCSALKYIKFGKKVKAIKCKLPALEGVAFHSPQPPAMEYPLTATEVWAPVSHLSAYSAEYSGVKGFEILPEQENTLYFYTKCSRPVSFDIESAKNNTAENYFFLYRTMDYGGLISKYTERIGLLADVNVHTAERKPLPYTVHFSDPTVAVLHGPNVFPSSDESTLQMRYTVPGDYEMTVVSNDFTRATYRWKVVVRNGDPVTEMAVNGPLFLNIGETAACKVRFNRGKNTPTNTDVVWTSANEDVIKIDENGNVTAIGEGTVLITARSADPACSDIFAEHQIIVTAAGVTSFAVPQIKAISNTYSSYENLKTEEIQTEFHVGIIPGSDNTGIITAPSVNLSSDGSVPQTPYNFGYKGRECIQQFDAIKLMSSPVIDEFLDILLYADPTGRAEAVRTPLVIPSQFNVIWDGRLGTIDIVKIGDYAFAGSNIEYAHIPKFVLAGESGTTKLTELGNYVFAECHSYKGLTEGSAYDVVPDFITKMGRGVFKNCDKMEIMSIGDGITELPEETFDGCDALKQVRLGAGIRVIKCSIEAKEVIAIASEVVPQIAPGCTLSAPLILVPAEHLEKYQKEWGWDNIKPYGITVEDGRQNLGAYSGKKRTIKVNVQGYNTDKDCYYAYPYLVGNSSLVYKKDEERPYYRVEFDNQSLSAFDPYKECMDLTLSKADDVTIVSTDITRAKITIPLGYKKGTPVSSVSINSSSLANPVLKQGEIRYLSANVLPSGATDKKVVWSVSDPTVASISSSGKLTGLKKGLVTVTVTTADTYSNIYSASAQFEVRESVTDMTLLLKTEDGDQYLEDGETLTCEPGETLGFDIILTPSGKHEQEIIWSLEVPDQGVAYFDAETKILKAIGEGSCVLKATLPKEFTFIDENIVRVVNIDIESPAVKPDPTDPEEPVDPEKPIDPEEPVDPEEPNPEPEPQPNPEPEPIVPVDPSEPMEPQPEPDEPENDIDPEESENPDSNDSSDISSVESDSVKISVNGLYVTVKGSVACSDIRLYSLDGRMVASVKNQGVPATIRAPRPGIYILLADRPCKLHLH